MSPAEVWERAWTPQPVPPWWVVVVTAALAAGLVLPRPVWPRTRHVVTIAHEGAHGVAALLTGRRLGGIRLHSDTSGLTVSSGRPTGPGMVVTTAAGYLGPSLLGLAAAMLLGAGYAVGLLWTVLALLALLLLQIRNWFGLVPVLASGAVVLAVTWELPDQVQSAFAYVVTWFLLLAAPRAVVELHRERRRAGAGRRGHGGRGGRTGQGGRAGPTSDADQLARLTRIPGLAWVGFFLAATVAAAVLGAALILAPLTGAD